MNTVETSNGFFGGAGCGAGVQTNAGYLNHIGDFSGFFYDLVGNLDGVAYALDSDYVPQDAADPVSPLVGAGTSANALRHKN